MNAKTLHTLCVVGATDDAVARIQHLLDAQSAQLHARWRLAAHADAELLVIDPDSTYGHMDWLRAQAQGRCIVAFASQPEAYPNDACLRKPIDGGDLVAVLNRVGTTLPARPATPAAPAQPIAAPSTAAGTPTTTQPKQSLPAAGAPAVVASTPAEAPSASVRVAAGLLELLAEEPVRHARLRLRTRGLPDLYLDPRARVWHADASLKGLGGWCTHTLAPGDMQLLDEAAFATAVQTLPAHPYARLAWLVHLVRGNGTLEAGLDPQGRYQLARWPQSEREFPRHFRIATVMLKQAATVAEIASQTGASPGDVADFINAYHALGYVVSEDLAGAEEESRRGGLFGRHRKISSNA